MVVQRSRSVFAGRRLPVATRSLELSPFIAMRFTVLHATITRPAASGPDRHSKFVTVFCQRRHERIPERQSDEFPGTVTMKMRPSATERSVEIFRVVLGCVPRCRLAYAAPLSPRSALGTERAVSPSRRSELRRCPEGGFPPPAFRRFKTIRSANRTRLCDAKRIASCAVGQVLASLRFPCRPPKGNA